MFVCEYSLHPAMANGAKNSAFQLNEKIRLNFELIHEWTFIYFTISLKKINCRYLPFVRKALSLPGGMRSGIF